MQTISKTQKQLDSLQMLLGEMVKDNLVTVSVTRKQAFVFCQMFQNFPIKRYNYIYLKLKASIVCIDNKQFDELNVLQTEILEVCEELLNCLVVGSGRAGSTMANVLYEIKCAAMLTIKNNFGSDFPMDYERSIGLSKYRRFQIGE